MRGLFGRSDYDLPITRVDSTIAILTAPNGYGKTHLLHMIDAVARQDYQELSCYTFDSLEIQLADQSQMKVTRTNSEGLSGICWMELQEQSPSTGQERQAWSYTLNGGHAGRVQRMIRLPQSGRNAGRAFGQTQTHEPICHIGCRSGISTYSESACCLQ